LLELDPSEITCAFHRAESVLSVLLLLEIAFYRRKREQLDHVTAGKAMVRQYRKRAGKALPMGPAPAAMTQNNSFHSLRGKTWSI